jgi:hypothetical protein
MITIATETTIVLLREIEESFVCIDSYLLLTMM